MIILVMCFKPILPVVEYGMNYEYIAKVLRVNKSIPLLHCNGKCHLMKELAKASDKENPISDKKIVTQTNEILFFKEIESFQFNSFFKSISSVLNTKYTNLYFHLNVNALFRPPIFI